MTRRGFSLVETLVVLAVTAALVAVTVTALAAARRSAQTTRCLAALDNWHTHIAVVANDHNDAILTPFPEPGPQRWVLEGEHNNGLTNSPTEIAAGGMWLAAYVEQNEAPDPRSIESLVCPVIGPQTRGMFDRTDEWTWADPGICYHLSPTLMTQASLWNGAQVVRSSADHATQVSLSRITSPSSKAMLYDAAEVHSGEPDLLNAPKLASINTAGDLSFSVVACDGSAARRAPDPGNAVPVAAQWRATRRGLLDGTEGPLAWFATRHGFKGRDW